MFRLLASLYRDAVEAEDLGNRCRALLCERLAQILEVAGAHIVEHFYFFAINGFQHILVIEGFEESRR